MADLAPTFLNANRFRAKKFLRSGPRAGQAKVSRKSDIQLDLVTVAFNRPSMVALQTRTLASRLRDKYEICVLDNSDDDRAASEIEAIASGAGVHYVRLPRLAASIRRDPSLSHGLALTWAYRHWLGPRGAPFVGTLDHDVFPLRSTSLVGSIQDSPVWGLPQERTGDSSRWYPWPGLTVINSRRIPVASLDLRPDPRLGLDTGGKLAHVCGPAVLGGSMKPVIRHEYERFGEADNPQAGFVEVIGDWLHVIDGSNWSGVEWVAEKRQFIDNLALCKSTKAE